MRSAVWPVDKSSSPKSYPRTLGRANHVHLVAPPPRTLGRGVAKIRIEAFQWFGKPVTYSWSHIPNTVRDIYLTSRLFIL